MAPGVNNNATSGDPGIPRFTGGSVTVNGGGQNINPPKVHKFKLPGTNDDFVDSIVDKVEERLSQFFASLYAPEAPTSNVQTRSTFQMNLNRVQWRAGDIAGDRLEELAQRFLPPGGWEELVENIQAAQRADEQVLGKLEVIEDRTRQLQAGVKSIEKSTSRLTSTVTTPIRLRTFATPTGTRTPQAGTRRSVPNVKFPGFGRPDRPVPDSPAEWFSPGSHAGDGPNEPIDIDLGDDLPGPPGSEDGSGDDWENTTPQDDYYEPPDREAGEQPDEMPLADVFGIDAGLFEERKTTRMKDGRELEWFVRVGKVDSLGTIYSKFDQSIWGRTRDVASRYDGGNKHYIDYYCKYGGCTDKYIKALEKNGEEPKGVGFTPADMKDLRCPARVTVVFDRREKIATISRTVKGHSHEVDRMYFSQFLAKLDPSQVVLDVMHRVAVECPDKTPYGFLGRVVQYVHSSDLSPPEKEKVLDSVGLIKREHLDKLHDELKRMRRDGRRFTLEELLDLKMKDMAVADRDEHDPFIIGVDYMPGPVGELNRLAVTISTLSWMKRALTGLNQSLLIDATHSTNTASYKLILVGVEDANRKLFPVAFSITMQESSLEYSFVIDHIKAQLSRMDPDHIWAPYSIQGDGATGLTLSIKQKFPVAIRLVCYFHVVKNVVDYMERHRVTDNVKEGIDIDFAILAGARDRTQFLAWVVHFKEKYVVMPEAEDVIKYLFAPNGHLDVRNCYCNFYWGAAGINGLWNARTNNSVESYHRSVHRVWFLSRAVSFRKMLPILKGEMTIVDSLQGADIKTTADYYHPDQKFLWSLTKVLCENVAVPDLFSFKNTHWGVRGSVGGDLYVFGANSEADAHEELAGHFNPFQNRPRMCLTYIPHSREEIFLSPPVGAACTCSNYIWYNKCEHTMFLGVSLGLVDWHPAFIRVGVTVRSMGVTKPKERQLGMDESGVRRTMRFKKSRGKTTDIPADFVKTDMRPVAKTIKKDSSSRSKPSSSSHEVITNFMDDLRGVPKRARRSFMNIFDEDFPGSSASGSDSDSVSSGPLEGMSFGRDIRKPLGELLKNDFLLVRMIEEGMTSVDVFTYFAPLGAEVFKGWQYYMDENKCWKRWGSKGVRVLKMEDVVASGFELDIDGRVPDHVMRKVGL
jgi:hypothetical protein